MLFSYQFNRLRKMHVTRSRTAQLRAQEWGEQIDPAVIANQIQVNPADAQGPPIIEDQQIDRPIEDVDPAAREPDINDDQQGNGERQHRRPADYYRPVIRRLRGFIDNHRTQIETDLRNHQQQQRQNREALELLLNERNEHLNQSERDLNVMVEQLEIVFRRQEEEFIRRRDELNQRENQLNQTEIRLNGRSLFNEQRNIYLHNLERSLLQRERRILPQLNRRHQHDQHRGGRRRR